MSSSAWVARGIRIEGNKLIVDARPSWDNKKKWDGEFEFVLNDDVASQLQEAVEEAKKQASHKEIAERELDAIRKELEKDYQQHKQKVLKDTGLSDDDLDPRYDQL